MVINIHAGELLVNQSRTQEQLTFNDILPFLLKSIFFAISVPFVHVHILKLVNAL